MLILIVNSTMEFKCGIYIEKENVVEFSLRRGAQTMSSKNKHLTYVERLEIQESLTKGMTFKAISRAIGKDPTTISKEVKRHLETHKNGFTKIEGVCPKLLKAPYVCNGCDKKSKSSCRFTRQIYNAKHAQLDYDALLVESRTGTPLSKETFYEVERIISSAVKKGQHIYHVIKTNDIPVSTSTVYRHINKGYYTISRMDLPRAVKFKPRKQAHPEYIPSKAKLGRTYTDFLAYMEEHNNLSYGELDTVVGREGGKVIMTIHFVASDFMVGILLDNKTAAEASSKIRSLKSRLESQGFSFGDLFPVMLTDNGGEFSCVSDFENDLHGTVETRLFFCEPYASYEKPHIEKNHTLFRDIVPKGYSFDNFDQEIVNTIFSHVNAVKRKQFNGKSAYDMFTFTYSEKLASALGVDKISPEKVIQSPLLLK